VSVVVVSVVVIYLSGTVLAQQHDDFRISEVARLDSQLESLFVASLLACERLDHVGIAVATMFTGFTFTLIHCPHHLD